MITTGTFWRMPFTFTCMHALSHPCNWHSHKTRFCIIAVSIFFSHKLVLVCCFCLVYVLVTLALCHHCSAFWIDFQYPRSHCNPRTQLIFFDSAWPFWLCAYEERRMRKALDSIGLLLEVPVRRFQTVMSSLTVFSYQKQYLHVVFHEWNVSTIPMVKWCSPSCVRNACLLNRVHVLVHLSNLFYA